MAYSLLLTPPKYRMWPDLTPDGSGGGSVPFTSVEVNGWSVVYSSPPTFTPDTAPETFAVSRQGWSDAGSATTYVDNLVLTKRVRQPYPNQASLTADKVAISDFIYSTDTIPGVINNSAEVSPAPICQWPQCDRRLVGDLLEFEVTVWHRDGRGNRQIPCFIATVSDGVNAPVTQTQTAPLPSISTGDRHAVIVLKFSMDVSSLNTGQITLNGKAFAFLGGASGTVDSATNGTAQGTRDFCPQIFWRDVALLGARPRLYLDVAGNDATGYVGANDASAAAAPFLTLQGALVRARVVLGVGACDGLIVFMRAGTWELTASIAAGNFCTNHEILFTRDPAVPRASAIFGFGTVNSSNRVQWLRMQDVSVKRTGTYYINSGVTDSKIIFKDADLDNTSWNVPLNGIATSSIYFEGGVNIINGATNLLGAGTCPLRLLRGVTYGSAAASYLVEGWCVLGCELTNIRFARGARSASGSIIAFNRNMQVTDSPVFPLKDEDATGFVIAQNVVEYISATTNPSLRLSGDGEVGNLTHGIHLNNTYIGANLAGRSNIFYDDGPLANLRAHKLNVSKGNIHVQINYKSDIFAGANAGLADASLRVLTWSYGYGVGCAGEFSMYVDASGGADGFRQDYPGLGSLIGTSATVRQDPLFTNYQGTTMVGATHTAGVGGGDYTIPPSSPCAGMVSNPALSHDLLGLPRLPTADAAGAYAA